MTNENDILPKLNHLFQEVLDEDDLQLTPETTAKDVEGWDSLSHVRLMLSVEKEFHVTLSAAEIGRLKNVGDLIRLLQERASR